MTQDTWNLPGTVLLNGCELEVGTRSEVQWLLYQVDGVKGLAENLTVEDCTRSAEFEIFTTTNQAMLYSLHAAGPDFPPMGRIWTDGQDHLNSGHA